VDRWYIVSLLALGLFLAGMTIGALWAPRRRKEARTDPTPPAPLTPRSPERTTCDWDAELVHLLEELGG
jgi:hypothetical protein